MKTDAGPHLPPPVLLGILLRVLHHVLDIVFTEASGRLDHNCTTFKIPTHEFQSSDAPTPLCFEQNRVPGTRQDLELHQATTQYRITLIQMFPQMFHHLNSTAQHVVLQQTDCHQVYCSANTHFTKLSYTHG